LFAIMRLVVGWDTEYRTFLDASRNMIRRLAVGIMLRVKFVALSLALGLVALAPSVSWACTSTDVAGIDRGTRFDPQPTMVVSWASGGVSTARSGR
jgi:hypothetical protein